MANVSRRTVAKGVAWSVPVVAVGAATPARAASLCIPEVEIVVEGSYKCCTGQPKAMQLVLQFTASCTLPPGSRWCLDQVQLGTDHNPVVWTGEFCGEVNGLPIGPLTICDTPQCTVNLIARIYPEGTTDYQLVAIMSSNIPPGQDLPTGTDCGCAF